MADEGGVGRAAAALKGGVGTDLCIRGAVDLGTRGACERWKTGFGDCMRDSLHSRCAPPMLRASWRAFRPTVRPFISGEPLAPPLPMHLLSWEHACVLSVFGSALAPRRAQALTRDTQAVRHSTPALLHRAFRRATRPCKITRLVCIR